MKIPESLKWKHTGKTLGHGGQAQILEVVDKTSDPTQTYALKPLGKNKPKQAYQRFYREIHAIKAASHPYIIKIIDHSNEGDDFNFYVMELVPGAASLKAMIESHLGTVLEKTIQEKDYDRPLPYEAMELSKKIGSVIEAGFPPIELIGKQCPVCGFGELTTEHAWKGWGKGPPEGMVYFVCNHCGFYFAQNKSVYDENVKRGRPESTLNWTERLRGL